MQRQKVENPFTLGPTTGRVQAAPDLTSHVGPRSNYHADNTGIQMIESLVNFAGVAGSAYTQRVEKKVAADKIVQSARAHQGAIPTTDATKAGYRAHAAVTIQARSTGAQARLSELAKENITQESWESNIRKEYADMDSYLMKNYDTYSKDLEMQKLSALSLREAMPRLTALREASKVGYEIESRINKASDLLINSSSTGALSGTPNEDLVAQFEGMTKRLNLTSSQTDKVIVDAIVATENPDLIRLAEHYNGERKTSLATRNGQVQSIKDKIKREALATNALNLSVEQAGLHDAYVGADGKGPTLTKDEVLARGNRRNMTTNNTFLTPAMIRSWDKERDIQRAAQYRQDRIMEIAQDGGEASFPPGTKETEKQIAFEAMYDTAQSVSAKMADKAGLTGAQKDAFLKSETKKNTMYAGDLSVNKSVAIKSWTAKLKRLSNLTIEAESSTREQGSGTVVNLTPASLEAIDLIKNLSPNAREFYFNSMNNEEESKVLRTFMHLKGANLSNATALSRAQKRRLIPEAVTAKLAKEGVKTVMDDSEAWFLKDISDIQRTYLEEKVREYVTLYPDPSSELATDAAKARMNKNWTVTKKGLRLEGNALLLKEATKINPDRFDTAFEAYTSSMAKIAAPALSGLGQTMKHTFPVTDLRNQTVTLWTSLGPIVGTEMPLSELPLKMAKRKEELQKIADKEYDFDAFYNDSYGLTQDEIDKATPNK